MKLTFLEHGKQCGPAHPLGCNHLCFLQPQTGYRRVRVKQPNVVEVLESVAPCLIQQAAMLRFQHLAQFFPHFTDCPLQAAFAGEDGAACGS